MTKKYIWLAAALAVAGLCFWLGREAEVLLWRLVDLADACRALPAAHPIASWLAALALFSVAVNLPVPVAAPLKVLAGYLFGATWGFGLNVLVSTLGGTAGFLVVRHLFARLLYSRHGRDLARVNLEIARNGFWYVLSSRFILVTPFFLVNVLAGLSSMRLRAFATATFLGVMPSSLLYAFSGERLGLVRCAGDLMSPQAALALTALGLAAVLPALAKRKRSGIRDARSGEE